MDIVNYFISEMNNIWNFPRFLADTFKVDVDAVFLVLSIFAAYPANLLYVTLIKRFHSAKLNCLYYFLVGFGTIFACYGLNSLHSLLCCCLTYIIVCLMDARYAIVVNGIFNFSYLLCGYYLNQQDWKYSVTWTMPQCVLTLRLIAFTFDVYDGTLKSKDKQENERHTACALPQIPSFVQYFSYCYYPGSLMVGPLIPFVTYQKFIHDRSGFNSKAFAISISRLFVALVCMFAYVFGSQYYPINYLLSKDYFESSFFWKITVTAIITKICMYKYIFAWMLAESANIVSGITFDDTNYYNHCNINLSRYEMTSSFTMLISAWNMTTNQFAFRYVYRRLKFLGNVYLSQFVTLSFLSLWHGVASGYWFAFSAEFLLIYFEKHMNKVVNKLEHSYGFKLDRYQLLIWAIGRIYTFYLMGYSFVSFMFLFHEHWVPILGAVHFYLHVILIFYVFLSFIINAILHI